MTVCATIYHEQSAGLTTNTIDDDFRGKPLGESVGKRLGKSCRLSHGLRLGGVAGAQQRPYLLTAQEFDPSYGAITVVCDLRFENVHDAENTSCAILTRSSDQRSKPDTPWQDLLARSVSCRLAANSLSGEGMLEAGTKYEADRELTNISWGGFSRPQTDTLYRLAMRDDGLNVTFTVSLAGNQLVRKNITCRSLFRGNQNFIAFEGPSAGTVVIERLMISQDGASVDDAAPLASDAASEFVAPELQGADTARQMLELTPNNAQLLVQDDFDDGKLNSNIWTTLGDVVIRGARYSSACRTTRNILTLGAARPYLLSKEQFDPADGGLIVIGKVTFAKNFLHGYGGSFAVMTRAAHAHGDGPGWENSILRRGIRSNFWPAAYGSDHSLEIHEKPDANTIHLSTAEGFQISPNSRSYYFQIVDDGRSATLTFIDSANPAVRKSVTHATMSRTLSNGYIGFESCWGSPVLLDSVRIYRVEEEGQGQQDSRD